MQVVHKSERPGINNEIMHQAIKNLLNTAYLIRKQQENILSRFGMNIAKMEVLQIVYSSSPDGISQKEIRERMMDKTVDLPRLLQYLSKEGLIKQERSLLNKRLSEIVITKEGIELLDKVGIFMAQMNRPSNQMDNEEAIQLINTLQKLNSSLSKSIPL